VRVSTLVDWIGMGTGVLLWVAVATGLATLVGMFVLPVAGVQVALAVLVAFVFLSLLGAFLARRAERFDRPGLDISPAPPADAR
jgi:hypothetical protein